MRYYLARTEDPNMELSWAFGQRAEVGEEVVGQDREMVGWWYLLGIYFTAVSLVSCPSPTMPHSSNQMTLALVLHLFGWVFASLLMSTLAAWWV